MDKDDENYKNRKRVKDHCHYTGKFKGAAHSKCNVNYKVPKDIPIIIHNAIEYGWMQKDVERFVLPFSNLNGDRELKLNKL